jgi:hypothetical protein
MWRATLFVAVAMGLAAPAMAIGKYDTNAHSCEELQRLLASDQQAILRYPSRDGRVTLYDRFVSNAAQCGPGQYGVCASIPTTDGACRVGNCHSLSDFAP